MADRSRMFIGRSFSTTYARSDEPVWEPLERFARLVWQQPELPQFHPVEFMHMASVANQRLKVRIHLYKHVDTRCYLNLDDACHAYAFLPRDQGRDKPGFSGWYRRHSSPVDAIAGLCLRWFETERLFRTFPPEEWPALE